MSRARGFTLIELLVALAIFALLAAFAYRGLNTLLASREALAAESRKWRDVAVFVGRVERDVDAVLQRGAASAGGTPLPAMSASLDGGTAQGLALTRAGSSLHESALAAPRRVAYAFVEGRIERLTWEAVDAAPRAVPVRTAVLANVKALAFRFLNERGEWGNAWAPPVADQLPAAVEMTLELASGEKVVRLMDLPRR